MPEKSNNKLWLSTPVGELLIVEEQGELSELSYSTKRGKQLNTPSQFLQRVRDILLAYFQNHRPIPTLPLAFKGTPFQNDVWQALQTIPYGEIITYGELAARLKTSAQAIGNACRENPVSIIVPCHRVVAQNSLGGYGGKTSGPKMGLKTWLLQHEGALDK